MFENQKKTFESDAACFILVLHKSVEYSFYCGLEPSQLIRANKESGLHAAKQRKAAGDSQERGSETKEDT